MASVSNLSSDVEAALRAVDIADKIPPNSQSHGKISKCLKQVLEQNQQIELVQKMTARYGVAAVAAEAAKQILRGGAGARPTAAKKAALKPEYVDEIDIGQPKAEDVFPSWYLSNPPFAIPYLVKHQVAVELLEILGGIFFTMVQGRYPELLQVNNWDCPQSANVEGWISAHEGWVRVDNDGVLDWPDLLPDSNDDFTFLRSNLHIQNILTLHHSIVTRLSQDQHRLLTSVFVAADWIIKHMDERTRRLAEPYVRAVRSLNARFYGRFRRLLAAAQAEHGALEAACADIAARRAALNVEETAARQRYGAALAGGVKESEAEYKTAHEATASACAAVLDN
ncbi:hypothetical protein NLG97_g6658 [Lecanicillium saksenae]|uniref:Uncharacterized protein n=1 Tax=Lecanicillium saksenae TaxID=468837 RepID=A0ACC1QP10_9HYPO|nr:hypothetical protein NLG97_g6658 [Lecanicillium saksenae]